MTVYAPGEDPMFGDDEEMKEIDRLFRALYPDPEWEIDLVQDADEADYNDATSIFYLNLKLKQCVVAHIDTDYENRELIVRHHKHGDAYWTKRQAEHDHNVANP